MAQIDHNYRQTCASLAKNSDELNVETGRNDNDKKKLIADMTTSTAESRQHLIAPERCRGCTFIIEPLMFAIMLTEYPFMLIMPRYMQQRELQQLTDSTGTVINSSTPTQNPNVGGNCNVTMANSSDPWVMATSEASLFDLQTSTLSSVPAICVAALLGPYSDQVGRKYVIIPPLIGRMVLLLNTVLNSYFKWPLEQLLFGYGIYGISGGFVTTLMGLYSCVSDLTTKENRSFRIVVAEICSHAPAILAAAGSGFWLDTLGFTWVFFILFLSNILILLYAIFLVPETIRRNPNARFLTLDHLKRAVKVLLSPTPKGRRLQLMILLLSFFIYMVAQESRTSVDSYFTLGPPLCWGAVLYGFYTAAQRAMAVVGSPIIARTLTFLPDVVLSITGGTLATASSVFKYFVVNTVMMFANAFSVGDMLFVPAIRSIISKMVEPNEVGVVFACVAIVETLCKVLGRIAFNPVFALTEKTGHPSTVYLPMGAIIFMATLLNITFGLLQRRDTMSQIAVAKE